MVNLNADPPQGRDDSLQLRTTGRFSIPFIFEPQHDHKTGVELLEPAINWVNGTNNMINGSNNLVFEIGA